MSETVKILLTQNVMFDGAHHAAGETVIVVPSVAEQLVNQGLGVPADTGEGAAIDEPEPQGKEPTSPPPSPTRKGKR